MTARPPIDDVLDDFLAALAGAGGPAPEEPISTEELAAVEQAVAPLRLPQSLVATWRRFQTGEATVLTWMPMSKATFGLEIWRDHLSQSFGTWPRLLFPLAYASHEFVLVELAAGETAGGTLFRWAYDGGPAEPLFPDLETALACAAEGWRTGLLGSHDDAERERWRQLSAVHAAAGTYPSHLASFAAIDLHVPLSWPPAWQVSSGIDPAAAEPRGASATVAELRSAGRGGATVVGTLVRLAGSSAGSRGVLDDGTGELAFWCPAEVDRFGAVVHRRRVELDVVLLPPDPGRPGQGRMDALAAGVEASAVAGDLAAAQVLAATLASFVDPASTDAVATAARPLEDSARRGETRLRDGHASP